MSHTFKVVRLVMKPAEVLLHQKRSESAKRGAATRQANRQRAALRAEAIAMVSGFCRKSGLHKLDAKREQRERRARANRRNGWNHMAMAATA